MSSEYMNRNEHVWSMYAEAGQHVPDASGPFTLRSVEDRDAH